MTAHGRVPQVDVLVVGGGPVGLAAAIEARMVGHDVLVVEPRSGPIDKACGEGLMPGTLAALQRLDVDPDGHPLRGIGYRAPGRAVDHSFGNGPGRGVRRTTLHAALLDRCAAVGVEQRTARVDAVEIVGDRTTVTLRIAGAQHGAPLQVSARWLLACDGLHSTVRRLLGLERPAPARAPRRYGLRRHVQIAPWSDLVEVHWGERAEAYVTPVAEDLVGIALLGPRGTVFDDALSGFPELAARIEGAPLGEVRGAGPLRQDSRRRSLGPVRLVGDASGYVDALTGEGLRLGFAQARAAVATLDSASDYERAWRAEGRDHRLLTRALVTWATSPLRGAVVPVAAAAPVVFGAAVDRLAR
uniref:NAD(P)/FAD-dependent oxidoreductase n=1 Tax=Actinotalea sp. TaxID=1872145 RepID=UPI0035649B71